MSIARPLPTGLLAGLLALLACHPTGAERTAAADELPAAEPVPSRWVVLDADLELSGFFRADTDTYHPSRQVLVPSVESPWIPVPAEPGRYPPGTSLPPEAWVDRSVLEAAAAVGREVRPEEVRRREVLTAVLDHGPDGHLGMEWEGAAEGLLAMRGGRTRPGVEGRFHAVEAETKEPVHFVLAGLPPPREGSLVLRYADFLDKHVAVSLVVEDPADGVILLEWTPQGHVRVVPATLVDTAGPSGG